MILFCLLCCPTVKAEVAWFDGTNPVTYQVDGKVDAVVQIALRMFCNDMELVTGHKTVESKNAVIRIVQGKGLDDGFRISVTDGQVVIEGHNARGTAYGLLELSRMAGVSPWVWWGDVRPYSLHRLSLPESFSYEHTPSVTYRGIFINDEDWSFRRWSMDNMGPQTYKRLFELMLRLRANTLWPAMHEGTPGFFTVKGNKEMADSFGIVIGTSHCEPLLRNNVAEWDVKERGAYNYITNRERVQQYWTERLMQVKGSEQLFTLGMRGIHDGSMEGVKTPQEKVEGLQQVINDQRQLLRKFYNDKVEQVPQVFIPYKEVLEIMESGLKVPDDVTLMWCDDNYGYMTRLPNAEQQKRKGGGGVYYHLSYWGRPHDYLWLTTTQPGLIYSEMKEAYDHNCRQLWIANVHDPKIAAYDLELFLDMAWDINAIQPQTISQHLENWLCTQFGALVGKAIAPAMREWYRLNAIRRPEFMGWTQVELDKKRYPDGKSIPTTTEFTMIEAYERMEAFARIEATVETYRPLVMEGRQDAYFAHVLYPVHAAAAMSRKMLAHEEEGQRAYKEIQRLTEHYNTLNGGKWRGLMSSAPRNLPVFGEVCTKLPQHPSMDRFISKNACDYQQGEGTTIQMLGHSMNAVNIPKDNALVYEFESIYEGDAVLYTAMIPTHPNDKGDLRFQVQLDDQQPIVISLKEPYRSEPWKQNVLRCQALKKAPINISKGQHTLKVKALDNHIIMDQWMIDFNPDLQFYMIPTQFNISLADNLSLKGKRIGVIGDSYVRNHREPVENTWHYKFAQKHGMQYFNYGRNGNCIALDLKQWGTGMYKRYKEMNDTLDYVIVIAGHNDASQGRLDSIGIDTFRERLGILCNGLKEKYPQSTILFFTPWTCENFTGSPRQRVIDAMLEVCGTYGIPVFDAARRSNVYADSQAFRRQYFQGGKGTDTAHLNARGHNLFLPVAEQFILKYIK